MRKERYYITIGPVHCGATSSYGGIVRHVYGAVVHIILYDAEELKTKVVESDHKRRRINEKIREFREFINNHMNICSTFDCKIKREKWRLEFEKEILEELGVKYDEFIDLCKENALGEKVAPSDIVLSVSSFN